MKISQTFDTKMENLESELAEERHLVSGRKLTLFTVLMFNEHGTILHGTSGK